MLLPPWTFVGKLLGQILKEQDHNLAICIGVIDREEDVAICIESKNHVQGWRERLLRFLCCVSCWHPHSLAVFSFGDPGLIHINDSLDFLQKVQHAVGELLPLHQASGDVGVQGLLSGLLVSEVQILNEEPIDFAIFEGNLNLLIHHLGNISHFNDGLILFHHLLRDLLQGRKPLLFRPLFLSQVFEVLWILLYIL